MPRMQTADRQLQQRHDAARIQMHRVVGQSRVGRRLVVVDARDALTNAGEEVRTAEPPGQAMHHPIVIDAHPPHAAQ